MKKLLLASLITLLAFGTACGQAAEPEPVASDGIQVHGHWTVTVTNPDGTVDAVHEFENALAEFSADLLTALISDQSPGPIIWHIAPSDYPSPLPSNTVDYVSKDLKCMETVFSFKSGTYYVNELLAIQDRDSSLNGSPLRLTASCTVAGIPEGQSSTLERVQTRVYFGYSGYSGYSYYNDYSNQEMTKLCPYPNNYTGSIKLEYSPDHLEGKCAQTSFTKHDLSPTIPITNGQLLSFNVVISFS